MNFDVDSLLNRENLNKIPVWSACTSLVIVIGFIGFYTYSSLNRLPFVYPNIQVIIAIGIFNLIIIGLMLWALVKVAGSMADKAMRVTLITVFLTYNPGNLAANIVLAIAVFSTAYWDISIRRGKRNDEENQKEDSKNVELTEDQIRNSSELLSHLLIAMIGLFIDSSIFAKFYLIYYLLFDLYRIYTTRVIELRNLLVFCILLPMAVSYAFLNDTTYSLVGISKVDIELSTIEDPDVFKQYVLVYEDNNKYYLKDSTESDITMVIKDKDVHRLNILKPQIFKKKTGWITNCKRVVGRLKEPEATEQDSIQIERRLPREVDSAEMEVEVRSDTLEVE